MGVHMDHAYRMAQLDVQRGESENELDAVKYQSDSNKAIAMGQIDAQKFAIMQASLDHMAQIKSDTLVALEGFDVKLQIATLNYNNMSKELDYQHEEKMTQLGNEIEVARMERETVQVAANTVDTTSFLNS